MITHLNKKNKPKIVGINNKKESMREAIAEGKIKFSQIIFKKILNLKSKKGEISSIAIVAGILGAKKTSELIPLCQNIQIEDINIDVKTDIKNQTIIVKASVKTTGKTGVEMEALTAVSISWVLLITVLHYIITQLSVKRSSIVSLLGPHIALQLQHTYV